MGGFCLVMEIARGGSVTNRSTGLVFPCIFLLSHYLWRNNDYVKRKYLPQYAPNISRKMLIVLVRKRDDKDICNISLSDCI